MKKTTICLAAACGLAFCTPEHAVANVTQSAWISSTQFVYRIEFVPDFDQRRNTLPSNGSNYCVPTSFLNWGGYVARRGFPNQLPGPPPWNYNTISLNLALLGSAMQTDPDGGTGPETATPAANAFFGGRAFVLVTTGNNSNGYPRLNNLAAQAVNGALVVPRIGWYNEALYPVIARTGGHAVSLVRAQRSGSSQLFGIRDPAWESVQNLSTQSAFATNVYSVEDRLVLPVGAAFPQLMARINGYGGNSPGYLYGSYYIYPLVVLGPVNFSFRITGLNFGNLLGRAESEDIPSANGGEVVRVFTGLDVNDVFYVARNPGPPNATIFRYDRAAQQHFPLATLRSADEAVAASRHQFLYFTNGNNFTKINPYDPANPVGSYFLVGGANAFAYDDNTDELVGLRVASRQIVRIPGSFAPGISHTTASIPTQVPVAPGGNIDVRFGDGSVLIATPASSSAFILTPVAGAGFGVTQLSIPGNASPITGGNFTDEGLILVAGGVVRSFKIDPNNRYTFDPDSPFNGLATTGVPVMPRSRLDIDYAKIGDPSNADILPTDFSGMTVEFTCPADVNADGVVNFTDLNTVLTSFGQSGANIPGDTNGDGVINFIDLNTVLNAFGADDCL